MPKIRTIDTVTAKALATNPEAVKALPELKATHTKKRCCRGRVKESVDTARVKRILQTASLPSLNVIKRILNTEKIRIEVPTMRGTKPLVR